MELNPGRLICGRFELLREESPNTGVPVFGPTWVVLDTTRGEPARACLLDAALLPGEPERKAFVAALARLGELRDPALVPQVFVGVEGELVAVCYEPLQGAFALGDLYDGTASFDLQREAGELARQLARALAVLHERGDTHGMLAPESVFVGPRGPSAFQHGFAPLCARTELLRRCRAFHFAGVAPEVLAGGPFTPASDVYAWGAAMAQFVTGQRGEAALSAARAGEGPTDLPGGLWALVQAALSDRPEARPKDGADLLRRVESLQLAAPPEATGEWTGLALSGPAAGESSAGAPVVEPPPAAEPSRIEPAPEALSRGPSAPVVAAPVVPERTQMIDVEDLEEVEGEGDEDDEDAILEGDPGRSRGGPAGMVLPVTSFEEMLLTSDRSLAAPPGVITSSSSGLGLLPGDGPEDATPESGRWGRGASRSSSTLRKVHVLTEDTIVRKPTGAAGGTDEAGEVIIGGTKAEMEAASAAATVKLGPAAAAEAVQAAQAAAARVAAAKAAAAAAAAAPPVATTLVPRPGFGDEPIPPPPPMAGSDDIPPPPQMGGLPDDPPPLPSVDLALASPPTTPPARPPATTPVPVAPAPAPMSATSASVVAASAAVLVQSQAKKSDTSFWVLLIALVIAVVIAMSFG